jgi:asparagine synthase (glutamine-hydrolysing)
MCGIFALLNYDNVYNIEFINKQFEKGKKRGPEFSEIERVSHKTIFGFHRLAINGLNDLSHQPIMINDIVLICNGEIYNYKELFKMINIEPIANSDCEIIIHLYERFGIDQTLKMIDGVFAFVMCDNRICDNVTKKDNLSYTLIVARDPYGVRPLYKLVPLQMEYTYNNNVLGFASELKMLSSFKHSFISHLEPGHYEKYTLDEKIMSNWVLCDKIKYHEPTFSNSISVVHSNNSWITAGIQRELLNAVKKRYFTTDRPIACLLSGGLDSSLITALVNEIHKKTSSTPIETYSIGLVGSEDLRNARIVADYLQTSHTEVIVTEQEMCEIIPEVIYAIESYDTTSVRASIGNYLIGRYISRHSEAKVIFNGDGSDELCGGYLYMDYCSDAIEFDRETRRLLKDIHLFDVLRSDKCISSHGLEPRTPFLDRNFVNFYLSLPIDIRFSLHKQKGGKFLLRNAFSIENFQNNDGKQILPDEILWRKKEAFSDGVSCHDRSLFKIIQEFISNNSKIKPSIDLEKRYYKMLFLKYFENRENIVPYYWMPKYTSSTDPSARMLTNYK